MNLFHRLRTWWQIQTGEEETPLDGDTPAWMISLLVHLGLLVVLTVILRELPVYESPVLLTTTLEEELAEVPEEFFFSYLEREEIGANSVDGVEAADAQAVIEEVEDITEMEPPEIELEIGEIVVEDLIDVPVSIQLSETVNVQGSVGRGVTGAMGAIDRLTQEIKDHREAYEKVLVVWVFDQSVSLSGQRVAIQKRLDRIYEELGVIEASRDPEFALHNDKPILTSVVAFGKDFSILTPEPTDQLPEIKAAVESIKADSSGVERVFQTVLMVSEKYRKYWISKQKRKVMIVVFTDEAGDDAAEYVDKTVVSCRRYAMPVYVVGIPSPFGRDKVEVKWIDPDPRFDQSPQWTWVTHGPETLLPERIKLGFNKAFIRREEPMDSGFGPFGLTRLSVDTGGIYFPVHPSRNPKRPVSKKETGHLSGYIKHFFDPNVMRRYRPDYVSAKDYKKMVKRNKAKQALVKSAMFSWTDPMADPKFRFRKKSEADLSNQLAEAQKQAAKLEHKLNLLYNELKQGSSDREKILEPRWQAGYDLAMGRVLATRIRTVGYNHMLAKAKRGMKFQNERNDTWNLAPSDANFAGSTFQKEAKQARFYLERVVEEHQGTPWAMIASNELKIPLGWDWKETFTNVRPPPRPRAGNGNNNRPRPRNDRKKMIKKKTQRKPPRI